MRNGLLVLAACGTFAATCALNAAETSQTAIEPAQLVEARQGGMTMSVMTLTTISRAAESDGPVKGASFAASGLASFAKSLPSLFAAETQAIEGTEALPAIWSDPDGWTMKVDEYQAATQALQTAASANDREAFVAAVGRTKAACASCHASYRAE